MVRYVSMHDEEFATNNLNYVTLQYLFDQHHLLRNLDYWLEQRFMNAGCG